jgi:hypothetical protein
VNTRGIERHYFELEPVERVALIMAATARGDEHDANRLVETAPRLDWRVPDTFPISQAILEVTLQEHASRLSLAALFYRTQRAADDMADEPTPQAERMEKLVAVYGYLLLTQAAGWRLFCADRRLLPDAVVSYTAALPGMETLQMAEKEAADVAASEADVVAYFQSRDKALNAVITDERHAESLEKVYETRVKFWGGPYDQPASM